MTRSKNPFISRLGLLKNLQKNLLRGRWATLIGGPMLGKTTLALYLSKLINEEPADKARAIFMSAAEPSSLPDLRSQLQLLFERVPPEHFSKKLILLIDDCDHLLNLSKECIPEIVELALSFKNGRPGLHAICWVGSPVWGDWIRRNADLFKRTLRAYPLSAVPIREARSLIQKQLGAAEVNRVWQLTGGHPFLLEQYFEGTEDTSETRTQIEALSKRLSKGLNAEEKAILSQIDPEGSWMALDALKGFRGDRPEKELLDRLCMMGLIVRTLDQGSAVLRRTSAFLCL